MSLCRDSHLPVLPKMTPTGERIVCPTCARTWSHMGGAVTHIPSHWTDDDRSVWTERS